jgi:hypothetical protein
MNINQKNSEGPGRGGARPGAGRPKGSKSQVTVAGLLEAIENKTNGRTYEELLVEDFINARLDGDTNLTHKYHTLLSNKFVANLNEITVEDNSTMADAKQTAFLEAIKQLNNINKSKDDEDASN